MEKENVEETNQPMTSRTQENSFSETQGPGRISSSHCITTKQSSHSFSRGNVAYYINNLRLS